MIPIQLPFERVRGGQACYAKYLDISLIQDGNAAHKDRKNAWDARGLNNARVITLTYGSLEGCRGSISKLHALSSPSVAIRSRAASPTFIPAIPRRCLPTLK